MMPLTTKNKFYTIELSDDSLIHNVPQLNVYDENNVPSTSKPSDSLGFFHPDWLKQNQKVSILHDEVCKQGYLNINKDNLWEFVSQNPDGQITTFTHDMSDIQYSWKMRMQENTFDVGWQENIACYIFGTGQHVLATNLNANIAPPNSKFALAGINPDRKVWDASYNEKYDGLNGLNVFTEITVE